MNLGSAGRRIGAWLLALGVAWLAGCAAAPQVPPPSAQAVLNDAAFAAPSTPVDATQVFALSPAMRQYVVDHRLHGYRASDTRQWLLNSLFRKGELQLEYDAEMTRNAAQAFEARSGNCLSLVIMTAAIAREMNIDVRFQTVEAEEMWARSGDLMLAIGHVNLTLSSRPPINNTSPELDPLIVDFVPAGELVRQRTHAVAERTIVAMYMNNRAVETLAGGHLADAYAYAREAFLQDPGYTNAYNTLSVIYRRHGDTALAERVLRLALAREPDNTQVLANLMQVLDERSQHDEARALGVRLAKLQPHPPFEWFRQGVAAMQEGRYAAARDLFEKEVARAPTYHEFHFWLASAYARLGDMKHATEQLELAKSNSTTRREEALYAAKLSRLQALRATQ